MDSRGGGSLISRPYRCWLALVLRTEARLRSGESDRIFPTRENADAESVGRSTTSPASTDPTDRSIDVHAEILKEKRRNTYSIY